MRLNYSEVQEAFKEIFPDRQFNYDVEIKYSGHFTGYNANVRFSYNTLRFGLAKQWREVSKDIQLGLLQALMVKLLGGAKKKKITTTNIDLYHIFLKKVHISVPKTERDPMLEESFNRVNETYFNGMIDIPNLKFGKNSKTTLGTYNYGADSITMSSVLRQAPQEMLDYVMYHEMLHKKHKYNMKNGKSYHHTSKFRRDEKAFKNSEQLERQIKTFLTKKKVKAAFFDFFD